MDHQQVHVQATAATAATAAANLIAMSLSDLGSLQEAHSIL